MKEDFNMATQVPMDSELFAQIEAGLAESGFSTVQAFVQYCVEKELKERRDAEEKLLAERLRGLGYLE